MPYFILFLSLSFSLFLSSTLISFCVSLFLSVPPPSLSIFTLCFNAYLTRYLSLLLSACVFIKIKCFVSLKTLIVRNHSLVDRGGVYCRPRGTPTQAHNTGLYATFYRAWGRNVLSHYPQTLEKLPVLSKPRALQTEIFWIDWHTDLLIKTWKPRVSF